MNPQRLLQTARVAQLNLWHERAAVPSLAKPLAEANRAEAAAARPAGADAAGAGMGGAKAAGADAAETETVEAGMGGARTSAGKAARADGGQATCGASHAPPRVLAGIRGLVFDMGDVLYDAGAWRRWLGRLLGRMGVSIERSTLFRIWDRQYLDDVHRGAREYHEAFVSFLRDLGLSAGQMEEVLAASWARKRELESQVIPMAGARPALAKLFSMGVRLGVLSDSEQPAAQLQHLLARLGLEPYFASVVSSRDIGETKPAPACYQASLAALGLEPQEAAFVGHDALELAGAARLGMATIAFNFEPDAVADVYLYRIDALPALLAGGRARAA